MPRSVVLSLVAALLIVTAGCGAAEPPGPTGQVPEPTSTAGRSEFKVMITGQAARWNGTTRSWDPVDDFRRLGTLIIEPDPSGTGFSIGLMSGSFTDYTAGTLHVVSNTYLLRDDGFVAPENWQAKLTAATVTTSPNGHTATIDPRAARTVELNTFVVSGSPIGVPKQVLEGTITVETKVRSVSGTIELFGGGHIDTGAGAYASDVYDAVFTS
jgi:hypothetical protein